MKILNDIQQKLKANKGQYNKFGEYNYRSCEDILEAVKPLLGKAILTLSDEMVVLGEGSNARFYVKATAKLSQEGSMDVSVSAFARETLDKKKMDLAQITGAASSYARKYALNGLFCIDDAKDADSTNTHGKDAKATPKKDAPKESIFAPYTKATGLAEEEVQELLKHTSFNTPRLLQDTDDALVIESILAAKIFNKSKEK